MLNVGSDVGLTMSKITDKQARAIKPGDKPKQTGVTGLTLRPAETKGRGRWVLRYVSPVTGKRRDMGLGAYPDIPVAEALKRASTAREMIASGNDPILARQAQAAIPTFEQSARSRYAQLKPGYRNIKHCHDWISSLERHAFPKIGAIKVGAMTPQHFAGMLRPIWLEIPETARRIKQRCHSVMASCFAQGHTQGNPVDVVSMLLPKQGPTQNHQPAIPWLEVPAFVAEHLSRDPVLGARAALLFLILTAARSGEVRGARWREIDLQAKLWTVPANRMKAHKAHRVALSGAAVDLLREQWPEGEPPADALVFPSLRSKVLSDMALTLLLRKSHAPSDTQGRVATAHGFRSSFRNWAADHGYQSDIAERALAHLIGNKVQAAYERTDRLEARITMMEQWADHVTGKTGAKVVPIRANIGTQP